MAKIALRLRESGVVGAKNIHGLFGMPVFAERVARPELRRGRQRRGRRLLPHRLQRFFDGRVVLRFELRRSRETKPRNRPVSGIRFGERREGRDGGA